MGALIQTGIGLGLGLVAVPIIALISPGLLPVSLLILAFPLTVLLAVVDRSSLDQRGFAYMFMGRVVGSLLGGWMIVIASEHAIQVLAGGLIIAAVAISLTRAFLPIDRNTLIGVGIASGVMGTAAVVGGPPLALLNQNRPGSELRSTLSMIFAFGTAFSLIVIWLAGEVHRHQLIASLVFMPLIAVGFLFGRRFAALMHEPKLRTSVLILSSMSGAAALFRGLLG